MDGLVRRTVGQIPPFFRRPIRSGDDRAYELNTYTRARARALVPTRYTGSHRMCAYRRLDYVVDFIGTYLRALPYTRLSP